MDGVVTEIVGIGVTVGLAGAGGIGALLKWSLDRNIKAMDGKIDSLTAEVAKLRDENAKIREASVTAAECSTCRTECRAGYTAWMARLEGKIDNLLMVVANVNNGIGGAK